MPDGRRSSARIPLNQRGPLWTTRNIDDLASRDTGETGDRAAQRQAKSATHCPKAGTGGGCARIGELTVAYLRVDATKGPGRRRVANDRWHATGRLGQHYRRRSSNIDDLRSWIAHEGKKQIGKV